MTSPTAPVCSVPDCGRQIVSKGLCGKHYRLLARTGSTELQSKGSDSGAADLESRVSAACLERFRAEATRRQISLHQLVCETLETGPVLAP